MVFAVKKNLFFITMRTRMESNYPRASRGGEIDYPSQP